MDLPASQQSSTGQAHWLGVFVHPAFALVWLVNTAALIGIAMFDTTSGWLMTTLDLNPLHVSLVHVATNLPMFLFTLPAGAIADIVNPRRLIVLVSCAVAALVSIFAALVSFDLASPTILLLTTFLLSAAWALNAPAWLSILPSLVPKQDLSGAIAAHGVGFNLGRTLGPALGGFVIMHFGLSTPLWAFVGANFAVIAALSWWQGSCRETGVLPAERLSRAVKTGVRHAANNRPLRATLVRTFAVYPFAAAYLGLLPLIARRTGEGAEHYGMLLSMISAGAIIGSLSQRFLNDRINLDWMVAARNDWRRNRPLSFRRDTGLRARARGLSLCGHCLGDCSDDPLCVGPERAARLGAGPRNCNFSDGDIRHDDDQQRGMGTDRGQARTFGSAFSGGGRRSRRYPALLAVEAGDGRTDGPYAVSPLEPA